MRFTVLAILLLPHALVSGLTVSRSAAGAKPRRLGRRGALPLAMSTTPPGHEAISCPTDDQTLGEKVAPYLEMARVENIPAAYMFVMGGAAIATRSASVFLDPQVSLVAWCTVLITVTSMVVNDYFDYRLGTDTVEGAKDNVLARKCLTLEQAKAFVSRLYSVLLLSICLVPSTPVRFLLMAGSITTFLYTQHLKPVTFLKNAACGFICCLAPAVGGMIALHPAPAFVAAKPVMGITMALLFGIMHREILMDITDEVADRNSGVKTIPVRWGPMAAAKTALALVTVMSAVSVTGAVGPIMAAGWNFGEAGPRALVRLACGVLGSGLMWKGCFDVVRKGASVEACDVAVESGKATFLLVLLGFF
mmetsp:Transcript_12682/g.29810  ORF Transcript_12682/g.29810 Transcript_12682/m.29810 type:complete len:363 (+) Transcript_12682:111-1199(+)